MHIDDTTDKRIARSLDASADATATWARHEAESIEIEVRRQEAAEGGRVLSWEERQAWERENPGQVVDVYGATDVRQ